MGSRLIDCTVSSPAAIADAMDRLRFRGGFGLTDLAIRHATPQTAFATDAEGVLDNDVLLPDPAGSAGGMRLMPPGGLEAAIKPGKLLDLIQHPPEIDLREAYDPGTSSLDEIDEKRRELQYRKDWLEALLAVTHEELAAFDEARNQRLIKERLTQSLADGHSNATDVQDRHASDTNQPQIAD
jgi:hypothetical protein